MNLKSTRSIIDAIHDNELDNVNYEKTELFGLNIPTSCPGVPSNILNPKNTWQDKVIFLFFKKFYI